MREPPDTELLNDSNPVAFDAIKDLDSYLRQNPESPANIDSSEIVMYLDTHPEDKTLTVLASLHENFEPYKNQFSYEKTYEFDVEENSTLDALYSLWKKELGNHFSDSEMRLINR